MKDYFKFSLLVSVAVYLLVSFIEWDIFWIINIPDYSHERRGLMIVGYGSVQFICYCIWDVFDAKSHLS